MRYSSLHNCEHSRKCTNCRGNEKAIGVFVSGSETKQLGWIPKEIISEVERMGQVELKISLITFKGKEISFRIHFSN